MLGAVTPFSPCMRPLSTDPVRKSQKHLHASSLHPDLQTIRLWSSMARLFSKLAGLAATVAAAAAVPDSLAMQLREAALRFQVQASRGHGVTYVYIEHPTAGCDCMQVCLQARLKSGVEHLNGMQADQEVAAADATVDKLARALAALRGRASSGLPDAGTAQLGTAAIILRQAAIDSLPTIYSPAECAAQLRSLLPPAAHLAALMHSTIRCQPLRQRGSWRWRTRQLAAPAPTCAAPTWAARAGRRRGRVWAACAAGGWAHDAVGC